MAFDIFHINWILVDSIIIIFLLLILIAVKVFKRLNRWRTLISNERLIKISFKGSVLSVINKNYSLKRLSLIKDSSEKNNPLIMILKTSKKRKLINALAEAISSYSVDVIILQFKNLKKPTKESIKIESQKELMKLIQSLFEFFKQNRIHLNKNYDVINFVRTKLMYNSFIYDINNDKLILINPKLNNFNKTLLNSVFKSNNLNSKLSIIFSGKINRILKKVSLKGFIEELDFYGSIKKGINIFGKASNAFKYYETLLFGSIIKIIENK
ncbi:MAG: hypothetical protein ACFFBH_04945 [Promethearchaeota archaeon]